MKLSKLIVAFSVFLLTAPCLVLAADVTLAWDANDPAPTGYAIFQRDFASGGYDYANPIWPTDGADHQETTCTITVPDDVESAFVSRAYVKQTLLDGTVQTDWSGDSTEVTHLPDITPAAPQGLILQALQAMGDAIKSLSKAVAMLDQE